MGRPSTGLGKIPPGVDGSKTPKDSTLFMGGIPCIVCCVGGEWPLGSSHTLGNCAGESLDTVTCEISQDRGKSKQLRSSTGLSAGREDWEEV